MNILDQKEEGYLELEQFEIGKKKGKLKPFECETPLCLTATQLEELVLIISEKVEKSVPMSPRRVKVEHTDNLVTISWNDGNGRVSLTFIAKEFILQTYPEFLEAYLK